MTITDLDCSAILDPAALEPDVPALVPDGAATGRCARCPSPWACSAASRPRPSWARPRVARELGVAKSTACRMLAALAAGGMLERTGSGRYRLGLRLFEIGQLAVDRLMLRELAVPVLGELRDVLRETAQLAVPVGADVLYVDRLESSGAGTIFHTELYRRGPGHSSSAGKAMAAFNPIDGAGHPGPRVRPAHPVHDRRPGRYRQVLRQVRVDGVRGLPGGAHDGDVLGGGADRGAPRGAARWRWRRSRWSARRRGCWARGRSPSCRACAGPRRGSRGARPLVSAQPC